MKWLCFFKHKFTVPWCSYFYGERGYKYYYEGKECARCGKVKR